MQSLTENQKEKPSFTFISVVLKVCVISSPGWWLVENEDKRLAWFPAPYLELWDTEDDDGDDGFQLAGEN